MVLLENAVELGDLLQCIEIDTLRITRNCPRGCSHCSQDPKKGLAQVGVDQFGRVVDALADIRHSTGNDLLANYVLTTTDSDPFLHKELSSLVKMLCDGTGKRFYLLTSGWFEHRYFQRNADWIAQNPDYVERVALTLSNFPTNPGSVFRNARLLTNAVRTFGEMPEGKFVISPQYIEGVDGHNVYSRKQTDDLLDHVLDEAGFSRKEFSGRIHYRPITGLGRALTVLGVNDVQTIRIEAEDPPPIISTREDERIYSGLVDMDGRLLVMNAHRAILNRDLDHYVPANELLADP